MTTSSPINPILSRQQSLNLTLSRAVAVVGCGGVGSWTAMFLALAGVPKLYLFDHDTVSESNLNRLPLHKSDIGNSKSSALEVTIQGGIGRFGLRPDCDVLALSEWTPDMANALKLHTQIDWLICTTDTLANRCACYKWCQEKDIKYAEAAAEGEFGSATGSPAEWASDLERDPGYASVPVWVGPCVMAASLVCTHVLHAKPMDYLIRIGYDGEKVSCLTAKD